MTKLVDLSVALDPKDLEKLPPEALPLAPVVAPQITYMNPAEDAGKAQFCFALGCGVEDLPDGEGWGAELISGMSSHCGTHVDAPLHNGSTCGGKRSRTITEIALEELYRSEATRWGERLELKQYYVD